MQTATRFATSVSSELALMAVDAAHAATELAHEMRDRMRHEIELLADAFFHLVDGDWKDAALARQRAVLAAGEAMGVEVVILRDAYDCPRSWEWDVA